MKKNDVIPFVDLPAQHKALAAELGECAADVFRKSDFILGPRVEAFERAFARFTGTAHAVGVSTGLDALRLSLSALGLGPGDEVVVPASTFIATALAVSAVGAKPILVDCSPRTCNLTGEILRAALTPRTRAVIPVHLGGQPADMDSLLTVAKERGLTVIEDAAQAHGALYKGKPCGSRGVVGCFSFYPGKNLGACGDGGMITTNDGALTERLRRLRHYGQKVKYEHVEKGLNARLDALQAAILSVKLLHLPRWNIARRAHAQKYSTLLANTGDLAFQKVLPGTVPVYHLFMIETDHRDELQRRLEEAGIETGIHYPKPIHLQAAYRDLGHKAGAFPHAERRARRTLSLPMYAELQDAQIERVSREIKVFFSRRRVAC